MNDKNRPVKDTVEPLVRLRYPTAQIKLAEIIAKLTDIVTHADHYCNEAVSDARHDLAALEAARLYKPNDKAQILRGSE
jgi:hypothetical protein